MIYPHRIWSMPQTTETEKARRLTAERDQATAVAAFCKDVVSELAKSVRPLNKELHDRRIEGYARPLALLLRHLRVEGDEQSVKNRRRLARERIVEAWDRFWVSGGTTDLPPPLDLLVRSHFAYAFPGGEEMQELFGFSDAVFHAHGSLRMFEVGVDLFDTATRTGMAEVESDRAAARVAGPGIDQRPSESGIVRVWRRYHKAGRDAEWDSFVAWMNACRKSVRMPRQEIEA